MQTRFMHTSDWQLGVTRQFPNADSQARWAEARLEGIRKLGRLAGGGVGQNSTVQPLINPVLLFTP